MRSQIRGLRQAETNSQNGISFIQTAEGYLQESQDIMQRLRELSVQASNGIYSNEDRMQIQVEVSQLVSEVNRIASHAQFNGMNMLTGRFAKATGENMVTASMWLHIGANMDQRVPVYHRDDDGAGPGVQGQTAGPATRRSSPCPPPTAPTRPLASSITPCGWSTSSAPTWAPTRTGSSTP